jgi:hypothetical protein
MRTARQEPEPPTLYPDGLKTYPTYRPFGGTVTHVVRVVLALYSQVVRVRTRIAAKALVLDKESANLYLFG